MWKCGAAIIFYKGNKPLLRQQTKWRKVHILFLKYVSDIKTGLDYITFPSLFSLSSDMKLAYFPSSVQFFLVPLLKGALLNHYDIQFAFSEFIFQTSLTRLLFLVIRRQQGKQRSTHGPVTCQLICSSTDQLIFPGLCVCCQFSAIFAESPSQSARSFIKDLSARRPHPESETATLSHSARSEEGMGCVQACCWLMEMRWSCRSDVNRSERFTLKPAEQVDVQTMCVRSADLVQSNTWKNAKYTVWSWKQKSIEKRLLGSGQQTSTRTPSKVRYHIPFRQTTC